MVRGPWWGVAGRISALLAVPLAVPLALAAWGSPAAARDDRSYRIAEVVIDAEVRADGSLAVTEQRTFAYDGTYRGAFSELPLEDDQRVERFSLRDETGVAYREGAGEQQPGASVDAADGDPSVTWYYLLYPLWHLHAVEGLPVGRIQAAASSSSSSGGAGGCSGGGGDGGGGGSGGCAL